MLEQYYKGLIPNLGESKGTESDVTTVDKEVGSLVLLSLLCQVCYSTFVCVMYSIKYYMFDFLYSLWDYWKRESPLGRTFLHCYLN